MLNKSKLVPVCALPQAQGKGKLWEFVFIIINLLFILFCFVFSSLKGFLSFRLIWSQKAKEKKNEIYIRSCVRALLGNKCTLPADNAGIRHLQHKVIGSPPAFPPSSQFVHLYIGRRKHSYLKPKPNLGTVVLFFCILHACSFIAESRQPCTNPNPHNIFYQIGLTTRKAATSTNWRSSSYAIIFCSALIFFCIPHFLAVVQVASTRIPPADLHLLIAAIRNCFNYQSSTG